MVKLWLIIVLTVFVGIVTAILGLMNEARFVVILGRMLGAMLFVGILTYLLIFFFQTTYLKVIKIFSYPSITSRGLYSYFNIMYPKNEAYCGEFI